MEEERDFFLESREQQKLVNRFERMVRERQQVFFDVHELENIIDFYLDGDHHEKAHKAITYARKMHPGSVELRLKHAQWLYDREKYNEAKQLLITLEKLDITNSDIFLLLGNIFSMEGNFDRAADKYREAIRYAGDDVCEILLAIALNFEHFDLFPKAVEYLEKAMEIDKSFIPALFELAYCHDKTGNNAESIRLYQEYLDADPYCQDAWYNIGTVFSKMGQSAEAIESYDFAIALDDTFGSAYFNKANTLVNIERYEEAIGVYEDYIGITGSSSDVLCYIGECYEKLEMYDKAEAFYNRSLDEDENYADGWYGIGIILFYRCDYEKCLEYVKKAISIDEAHPEYWFTLGQAYEKLELWNDALSAFRLASDLDPFDEEIWLLMSELLSKNDRTDEAIDMLKHGLLYNESARINFRLAACHAYLCQRNEAEKHFIAALKIDADKNSVFFENCNNTDFNDSFSTLVSNYLKKSKNEL
ncbi:MAG: tetratricopeptide repeat protein [Bacteroidota bacterium]